jgi:hypothetical protein
VDINSQLHSVPLASFRERLLGNPYKKDIILSTYCIILR